ncbi:uncharacterized protein LOC136037680 isoform X2 [Artemia franciscana]|uniref:Short-chain dehydrogenase n=1 Tax=Artemia franciscana TaxID=6661 RepID=A0AA88IAJ0_ARTSF|nr:hypothetical protein QYM36_005553 [Artemia franciscana]
MKTVLITGSSRGIGLGLVKEYVKNGYKVVATCRDPETASDLKSTLAETNQPSAIALDVASDDSIFKAAEEVSKIVDSIDILINNAGVAAKNHPNDPAIGVDREDALRVYSTNVIGPLKVTEAFLPLLRKGNEKKVVNISSFLGSLGCACPELGSFTTYSGSKAALNMVTRYQAFELNDCIIASVEPGWVDTDMGNAGGKVKPPLTMLDCAPKLVNTIEGLKREDSSFYFSLEGEKMQF